MVRAIRNMDDNSPWAVLNDWSRDFDRLFSQMDRALYPVRAAARGEALNTMPCDIHETDSGYLISMDLPGVKKSELNIECTGNALTITGQRRQDSCV